MPKPRLEDCIHAIVPPGVSARVCSYYGPDYLSRKIVTPFWRKFNHDGAFQDHIWRKAKELFDIIFDKESHSWGNLPAEPQEGAGIGFILGKLVENDIDEMLLKADETEFAQLDAIVKTEGISLLDHIVKRLEDSKSRDDNEAETSRSVCLFI